jgi:hypothetical protein
MSLAGNLRTMALPDILQWISTGQKTGTLQLVRRSIQKRIIFHEGRITTSWSNDFRESLGQFLMRDRLITEEQLFNALLNQEEKGRLLGTILTSEGLVTEEELRLALKAKAAETIYNLFLWTEGKFEFKEGDVPSDVLVQIDLGVTEVIMEGIRRVDEWLRIREVFTSTRTTFKLQGAPQVEDPIERQLLGLVASGRTLVEISLEMHRSEFETARLLYELYGKNAIVVDKVSAEPREDEVGAIKDLLTHAYECLQERRYDEARKDYEDVLALDRLNQNAKKGLLSVADARNRDRAMRSIPLKKVPVLLMDYTALTRENFDAQEGFVLSRVNGQWDIQSILKLCPMPEEEALLIFARLLERNVIELR